MPISLVLPLVIGVIGLFAWTSWTRRRTPCPWEVIRADGSVVCIPAEIGDQAINMTAQAQEMCRVEPDPNNLDQYGIPRNPVYGPIADAFEARIIAGVEPRESLRIMYGELRILCPTIRPPRF